MKAHVGVDSKIKTKMIHSVVATAANVADCTVLPELLRNVLCGVRSAEFR